MDGGVVTFVFAIIIVAVLVFFAILLTGKRNHHHFNIEEYQTRFLTIENNLKQDNPASFPMSIINCDKLLDKAMIEMGIPGKTMGDRLKKAGDKFSNLNAVWRAHKLRNLIAHENNFEITYKQTVNAVAVYKQALKDLGAI